MARVEKLHCHKTHTKQNLSEPLCMHDVYYYANASMVILQARVNPRVQIYVRASVFTMNKRQHRNKTIKSKRKSWVSLSLSLCE